MVKTSSKSATQKRKPRILWANPFCLLDTSSGASMTVRQMLLQLVASGYEVQVLGATVFDNPKGMGRLKEQFQDLSALQHQLIDAADGPLTHQLVVSYSHNRNHFTTYEEGLWYNQYLYLLDSFKPDVVWFYGGQTLDLLIANEARDRGIPVAFYLANGNYKASNWCRDVDLILTDSQATAEMYRKEVGFLSKPVGKFIAPESFVAEQHKRMRLMFVNPSWQKGASVFVQLAEKLERERPDIELEVVEARADWPAVLRETTRKMGEQRSALSNVVVTPNTSDMRGPYSRARVVVAPSLWWESSGRILAEAMLNGIPALITNRGGMPEMIGDAGIAFDFPAACYKEPYQQLLSDDELQPLVDAVISLFDDEALYQSYVDRAWQVGKEKHHLDRATDRLLTALTPLVRQQAGNKDFAITQKKRHRQRLACQLSNKPEFKVDNSLQQLISAKSGAKQGNEPQSNRLWLTDNFTWQVKGKIMVLDNRASLIKSGLADQMVATKAFGIVAFDPASEVKDAKQYEGSDYIQLFQHALLGDGKAATLHACVAPEMTSTLTPLPAEKLPKRHHLGAKPLAEIPINTVALDSIDGLGNLDWLILDELSDAMAVLEHGKKALTDTLLIQARVAFQLTHEKQPNLAELQHWASRNGFRFYRFHNISHYSHLPKKLSAHTACATEQESGDVLFLPSHERMAILSEKERMKLAFILSAGFAAHDVAFDLIAEVSQDKALEFLEAQEFLPKSPSQNGSSISTIEDLKTTVAKAPLSLIKANHSLPGHLVVSLTSYKARFDNLHLTLRSLLLQEMCPDLLILWIAEDEKADLPEAVWQLEQYGLNIQFCEDIRSYKKIIPTLQSYPDSFIVTADDDIYYEPRWLTKLLENWDGNNKTVVAHRAHKILLKQNNKPLPYRKWKWEIDENEVIDGKIVPTGCGGVLYPPHVFHSEVTDTSKFMELCPSADDIWLYWMASLNGAKAKRSNYNFQLIEWPNEEGASLWKENIHGGGNDQSIKAILDEYGCPWEKPVKIISELAKGIKVLAFTNDVSSLVVISHGVGSLIRIWPFETPPTNEIKNIDIMPKIMLGDGRPSNYYVCENPAYNSMLQPFSKEKINFLQQIPVNTVTLNEFSSFSKFDWLYVDNLCDLDNILSYADQALREVSIIQVKVFLGKTHKRQCSIIDIVKNFTTLGFRLITMHGMVKPKHENYRLRFSENARNLDLIFIPTAKFMSAEKQEKIKYILNELIGFQGS
ncbi:glycosyltransferase [Vreelandella titanicae]|uniref:Glycosyltransferase n=1 Tax=Vreelandella titanicae TaxID=664683 RepID=A0A558JDB7_9GAMM|nr:glycosyltransferase [Halomonas titanicae]TVU91627.1 glycosyltransferase [Halomonas titanicae]